MKVKSFLEYLTEQENSAFQPMKEIFRPTASIDLSKYVKTVSGQLNQTDSVEFAFAQLLKKDGFEAAFDMTSIPKYSGMRLVENDFIVNFQRIIRDFKDELPIVKGYEHPLVALARNEKYPGKIFLVVYLQANIDIMMQRKKERDISNIKTMMSQNAGKAKKFGGVDPIRGMVGGIELPKPPTTGFGGWTSTPLPGVTESEQKPRDPVLSFPIIVICPSFMNFLSMALSPEFMRRNRITEFESKLMNELINNYNDHRPGWVRKQRICEGEEDPSADALAADWDFLKNSQAAELCRMSEYQARVHAKTQKRQGGKYLSTHFLNHNAFRKVKEFLSKEGDFGNPIIQVVKKPDSNHSYDDDRLCILTDKAIILEWELGNLNAVKSISFTDPIQLVEQFVGSNHEIAFETKTDISTIPAALMKKAYDHQKNGLGWELDHDAGW